MNAIPNDDSPNVSMALDHVIRAHGVLAVLVALILRPVRRGNDTLNMRSVALSDHLLRDIGMEPQPEMDKQAQHLRLMAMVVANGR